MKEKRFGNLNIVYREKTSDEEVLARSFENDIFLKRLPEYNPKTNHIVIDVGAHIGAFCLLLSNVIKSGKIFAIEPCKETYQILKQNISINGIDNILPVRLALSDNIDTEKLYYSKGGSWGHSITKMLSDDYEEVQSITLEILFQKQQISHCDLIKLNCEGAEFRILLSTPIKILKKIDFIVILYHLDLEENHNLSDLVNYLRRAKFLVSVRYKGTSRGWVIAMKRRPLNCIKYTYYNFYYFFTRLIKFISKRYIR